VSVYDKTGVVEFCTNLAKQGFEILSTGGTAKLLSEAGVNVKQVSDVTSFPEILGGRVKTLHPVVFGGVLARRTEDHLGELKTHNISPVDLVVCNLYPFVETTRKEGASPAEIIEEIDIGGVTLLRAAAKNHESVLVVSDPDDYARVSKALTEDDCKVNASLRRRLALKAFRCTAAYDSAISAWFTEQCAQADLAADADAKQKGEELSAKDEREDPLFPSVLSLSLERVEKLRYGENPHQEGALYRFAGEPAPFEQLQGKELSYNNLIDIDAAWAVPCDFEEPCVAIIKHTTPCGIATAASIEEAYPPALASDPVSAFGSIIAVNREVTLAFVELIGKLFLEVLVAPSFSAEALEWLGRRKKNCRVMRSNPAVVTRPVSLRTVHGGVVAQSADVAPEVESEWRVVTKRQPTETQMRELAFAWRACKHVKSNAIVLCSGTATVGVGCGQPNRVEAVGLAASRAGEQAKGSVLASDAFFPFADGLRAAASAGSAAVIQPGGSIRDDEVIAAADELGIVMVCTGRRHFKH